MCAFIANGVCILLRLIYTYIEALCSVVVLSVGQTIVNVSNRVLHEAVVRNREQNKVWYNLFRDIMRIV